MIRSHWNFLLMLIYDAIIGFELVAFFECHYWVNNGQNTERLLIGYLQKLDC